MCFTPEHLKALSLARYEFRLAALAEGTLPPFLGSTFRGSFGYALKAVACSMPHQECARCLLAERCLYMRLFEPRIRKTPGLLKQRQNAPRPFIFEPPLPGQRYSASLVRTEDGGARHDGVKTDVRRGIFVEPLHFNEGDELCFGLTLVGAAIEELPYVIYAVGLMARHGFGARRTPFALLEVSALDSSTTRLKVYAQGTERIAPHDARRDLGALVQDRLAQLALTDRVNLLFLTPTRLRFQQDGPGKYLRFEQLVKALSLRLTILAQAHGAARPDYDHHVLLAQARNVLTLAENLRQQKLERYSNRQGKKIEQDGFMGEVVFAGAAISELLPMLVAGEFLHVGSGTAFGLGRYRVAA